MVRIRESVYGVQCGKFFGKWEVIGQPFSLGKKRWSAVVKCECGLVKVVACNSLSSGNSNGCKPCHARKHRTLHGGATGEKPTRLYNIWQGMKQRCGNSKHPAFKDYGGRGIRVCQEWADSYEFFREWALGNGYDDSKQIDRFPSNDGGYEPRNCRWVSCQKNQRNRRSNLIVEGFGESKCLAEWVEDERCKVKQGTLLKRLSLGWNPEDAISTPCRPHKTYRQ